MDGAIFIVFLLANIVVGFRYRGKRQSFKEYAIGDKEFSTATMTATIVATWAGGNILFNALERTPRDFTYVLPSVTGDFVCLAITRYVLGPRMGKFLNNVSVPKSLGRLYDVQIQAIAGISTWGRLYDAKPFKSLKPKQIRPSEGRKCLQKGAISKLKPLPKRDSGASVLFVQRIAIHKQSKGYDRLV